MTGIFDSFNLKGVTLRMWLHLPHFIHLATTTDGKEVRGHSMNCPNSRLNGSLPNLPRRLLLAARRNNIRVRIFGQSTQFPGNMDTTKPFALHARFVMQA